MLLRCKEGKEEMVKDNFAAKAYRAFLLWGISTTIGSAICTFVDATLVGNYIGEEALAAVNIATPLFLFFAVIGITIASGANVLIGRQLGQANTQEANRLFQEQLTFALLVSVICTFIGVVFATPILKMLGANAEIIGYAKAYSMVVFSSSGLFILYQVLSFSVRSDGNPRLAAISSTVLIVLNIVLDIFFLDVLEMGIMGASLALCIGKFCSVIVLLTHFRKRNRYLKLGLRFPPAKTIFNFVKCGFGVGSVYLFQALVMSIFNQLLISSGANGTYNVALFTIIYTLSTFGAAFFDGASIALTPVISIFFGEKDFNSMKQTAKEAVKWVIGAGVFVTALYMLFAENIIRFFGMSEISNFPNAVISFRLFSVSLLFSGLNTLLISYWQSVGKNFASTLLSVLKSFILLLLFGTVLIPRYQTIGLGVTYICAEVFCLTVAGITYIVLAQKDKKKTAASKEITRTFEKTYLIRIESIADISSDIGKICEDWDIDAKTSYLINFIIEEITVNIIKFVLGKQKKERYIALKLTEQNGKYALRIRDDVTDYNPFETEGDAIDNAVMHVIKTKSEFYEYQRKLIFNYLYIKL